MNQGQWSEPMHTLQECEHMQFVMRAQRDTVEVLKGPHT